MVVFYCCCTLEAAVLLGVGEASFWTQTLKTGLRLHQLRIFGTHRHESVCLLLNIASVAKLGSASMRVVPCDLQARAPTTTKAGDCHHPHLYF